MANSDFEIKTERIRNSIRKDQRKIMEINIEYPQFKSTDTGKNLNIINSFYTRLAESFSSYCESSAMKVTNSAKNAASLRTMGEVFKYHVPYMDNKYLSVVCEITHYDGYFKNQVRACQTWQLAGQILLPCNHFLKLNKETRGSVRKKVKNMIAENIAEYGDTFSYTEKSVKKYAANVNPDNYFLCEKGIAFWFDKGTLAPESEGFPTYIIPYKKEQSRPNDSSET